LTSKYKGIGCVLHFIYRFLTCHLTLMKLIPTTSRWCLLLLLWLPVNYSLADTDLGRETYELACTHCHSAELAKGIQAPAAFDSSAWQARIEQAYQAAQANPSQFPSTQAYLLYQIKTGKGLMTHGGLCFATDSPQLYCSDEALLAAIRYMSGDLL
jgi:cytochrome c5